VRMHKVMQLGMERYTHTDARVIAPPHCLGQLVCSADAAIRSGTTITYCNDIGPKGSYVSLQEPRHYI